MDLIDLTSAKAKLERARELHKSLLALTNDYIDQCEQSVVHTESPDGLVHEWHTLKLPPFDQKWSLLAGDVAHNARTALDHAARSLVEASGGDWKRQYFPLHVEDPGKRPLIDETSVAVDAAVEAEQPFRNPNVEPSLVIHELDRIDKHRMILPAITAIRGASWGTPADTTPPKTWFHSPNEPVVDGTKLARFKYADVPNLEPSLDFDFEVRLTANIDGETEHDAGFLRRGDPTRWGLGIGLHNIGMILGRLERIVP